MPLRAVFVRAGALLLVGLLGAGCTPDSSGTPARPDSTAASLSQSTHTAAPARKAPAQAVSGTPPSRTVAQRLADASLVARAKQALVRARSLRRFTFSPSAADGRLTLRGDVDTQAQYRRAERIVRGLNGVSSVTNQLTVQGRAVGSDGAAKENAVYHTVRRGDTLSEIARAHGVPTRQLRALNDLSGTLRPGQRLRVR
jgi:osmotically-inducible protein OsmY